MPTAAAPTARAAARRARRKIDPRRVRGSGVYLLHFATPYKHAAHYVGYTEQLAARIEHHRRGTGARLMAAVSAAGIDFEVARWWQGADRHFERRLHNRHGRGFTKAMICPICSGEAAMKRAVRSDNH